MSRKNKKKKDKSPKKGREAAGAINKSADRATTESVTKKIRRYLAKGQSKIALQAAKLHHKDVGTSASEALLVETYLARIEAFIDNGQINDAQTLLAIVKRRYTLPAGEFQKINTAMAIQSGAVDDLVAPLALPDTPPATRHAVENVIKEKVVDLRALTQCTSLPDDHPLKIAAGELSRAFISVTTGPVDDTLLTLPQISRKSPLAPWKMLIRALAHFYRHEDERCAKYLSAIPLEAAPARLIPVIRSLMNDNTGKMDEQPARKLIETVTGNRREVRSALQNIDQILGGEPFLSSKKKKVFKNAVAVCATHCPPLMESLKQRISTKGWMNEFTSKDILEAMGGVSLKNAVFWRLNAHAAELKNDRIYAVTLWDEFLKHAVHEGWFPQDGQEASVLYLHMAGLLEKIPSTILEQERHRAHYRAGQIDKMYAQQPKAIRKAVQKHKREVNRPYFLDPGRLYQKALEIEPAADVFKRLLDYVQADASGWKETDQVALDWHQAFPDDAQPLLFLMQAAEKRNAFTKAIKFLEKAEHADGLNTAVKQARPRLLTAIAVRHLKQQKTHLAEKDFTQLEALPQLKEGDRPAMLWALRAVCALISDNRPDFLKWDRQLRNHINNELTVKIVMEGLADLCDLPLKKRGKRTHKDSHLKDKALVAAIARGLALGDEMGLHLPFPHDDRDRLRTALSSENGNADPAALRTIAEKALRHHEPEIAYTASGCGLNQEGAAMARFLFLRAQSLPRWNIKRRTDCLTAALDLARRERNLTLVEEIIEFQHEVDSFRQRYSPFHLPKMDTGNDEQTQTVIASEKADRTDYPSFYGHEDDWDMDEDVDSFNGDTHEGCEFCDNHDCPDRKAPYIGDVFEEEEDFVPESFEDMSPEELFPLFDKLFKKRGKRGQRSPLEELMDMAPDDVQRMLEMMLPPKRKNR